jgi:mannosyltransferase OCH1-like enzyme
MTQFVTIPKLLDPRTSSTYVQKIPKIIWQTMKTNRLPIFMKSYTDTWINLNPEYEYRFYDDNDIIDFLKTDFPGYLEGYSGLKYGASKADLWRYLIIYKYGGVYADIDSKCIHPLCEWVDPKASFVTQLGVNKDICQWLILSIPGNPIFLRAAEKTLQNQEKNSKKISYYGFESKNNTLSFRKNTVPIKLTHEVLALSGPPVLQKAAEECFEEGLITEIIDETQLVCVSGATSCQMNGNVKHDTGDPQYKSSYKLLHLKHYNSGFQRIKRKLVQLFSY